MFSSKILNRANFDNFTHLIAHGFLLKMGRFHTCDFITPFERADSKLLEKHKISVIGHSELN